VKTLIVIQARINSSRLPGKVMKPVAGAPVLQRMIERVQAARSASALVVATTSHAADDPIRDLCRRMNVDCYRGHPTDLLDRHYRCAIERGADAVVKIPSDCPLIDPQIIDLVISAYVNNAPKYEFVSNLHPPTFPDGNDVEVMSFPILEAAWREATKDFEREHTTPFIWERPGRFSMLNVTSPGGRNDAMTHRWTLDYEEDYRFIAAVYDQLWTEARPVFPMHEILALVEKRPDIFRLNAGLAGRSWYEHHLNELTTIDGSYCKQPEAAA
jgi:spore coat polysaccharide biosynthesis protein SpsF